MPLEKGSSRETMSKNIRSLLKEKYPKKQAIAIAMRSAGKAYDKKKSP